MDIDTYFTENNRIEESFEEHISPSKKYKLAVAAYNTMPGVGSVSMGKVFSIESGEDLFEVRRNFGQFPYCFVENHPNGHDYLICGSDYQGQTVLELDTGKRIDYLPKGAEKGVGFCWAQIYPSAEKTMLAVDGCFWACPYNLRFVDFSEPMNLPFLVLTEIWNTDDISAVKSSWSENKELKIVASDENGTKHEILWKKPLPQEVSSYWRSEVDKTNLKSHFLPDMQEQAQLAVKAQYKDKILGIRNYKSEKKDFNTSDFIDSKTLKMFLTEVSTGESDISPAGKAFLADYYGLEQISTTLAEQGGVEERKSADKVLQWLEKVQPMETALFIHIARQEAGDRKDFEENKEKYKDLYKKMGKILSESDPLELSAPDDEYDCMIPDIWGLANFDDVPTISLNLGRRIEKHFGSKASQAKLDEIAKRILGEIKPFKKKASLNKRLMP